MKAALMACLALLFWGPAAAQSVAQSSAQSSELTRAEAVNKAGRQRMLTQRIVKSYCQVGMEVDAARARAQLAEALPLFERQLAEVRPLAPRAGRELEELWPPFRALAAGPVSRAGAASLRASGARLLEAAERLTDELERGGRDPVARLVNLAGRQRMLSQRVAKAYMLDAWGIGNGAERDEIVAAAAEFGAALEQLRAAQQNTRELRVELAAVALQWEWLAGAVAQRGAAAYPLVVADASEAILQRMERITRMYEALGAR